MGIAAGIMPAVFALVGLAAGRWLHGIAARLPDWQTSHDALKGCPVCGTGAWWPARLPLAGWLLTRGRCWSCGIRLPIQEPLVELSTALLFVLAWLRYGFNPILLPVLLLTGLLAVVMVVDIRHHLIPNRLLGVAALVLAPAAFLTGFTSWSAGIVGALVCGGLFFMVAVFSRGGLGGGDVKFAALLGLILGWQTGLLALVLALLTGALGGLVLLLIGFKRRGDEMAFGPFMVAGALTVVYWGAEIVNWYGRGAGP